jgi:hypothetical protein
MENEKGERGARKRDRMKEENIIHSLLLAVRIKPLITM